MPTYPLPHPSLRSFADLAASGPRRLLSNLAESGFRDPTPIQRQAVPALLAGRELLAIAPTGSGVRAWVVQQSPRLWA